MKIWKCQECFKLNDPCIILCDDQIDGINPTICINSKPIVTRTIFGDYVKPIWKEGNLIFKE